MALNHIVFSVALILLLIIMIVYWGLLWKGIKARNRGNHAVLLYQVCCHSIPAIAQTYNFIVTDLLMYRGLTKIVLPLGILYFAVNFVMTQLTGNVTYWFLAWKSPLVSAIAIVLGLGCPYIIIHLLAIGSELAKQRKLPERGAEEEEEVMFGNKTSKEVKED